MNAERPCVDDRARSVVEEVAQRPSRAS